MRKIVLILLVLLMLTGCGASEKEIIDTNIDDADITNKNYFDNVLDIPNSKLVVDEEGRELLEIELTLDNVEYLRKYKSITNEYIDEFDDLVTETIEGYYCSLYDYGYRLIKAYDFASIIQDDLIDNSSPIIIWNTRATFIKIKGKLVFCKIEDYDSFGLAHSECLYYKCEIKDDSCIDIIGSFDKDFPF